MKRIVSALFVISLIFILSGCNGYNQIMREHLRDENNYHTVDATFVSYTESDDNLILYVKTEDKTAFDASEKNNEKIALKVIGKNCDILIDFFRNKDIDQGDSITLRCSTWIYMDGYFYYVAEVKAEDKQYLSFEDGLANIIAYMEDNKSLF